MKPGGKQDNNKKDSGEKGKTGKVKARATHNHEKLKFVLGIFLIAVATYILVAFIAYMFWWKSDASLARDQVLSGSEIQVKNWSGKLGVIISQFFITNGFGIGALFIPLIIAVPGLKLLNFPGIKPWRLIFKFAATTIIISLVLGYIFGDAGGFLGSGPGGAQGYFAAQWLSSFMGKPGTGILLMFLTLTYIVIILNISPAVIIKPFSSLKSKPEKTTATSQPIEEKNTPKSEEKSYNEEITDSDYYDNGNGDTMSYYPQGGIINVLDENNEDIKQPIEGEVPIKITKAKAGEQLSDEEVEKLMNNYDPRLDLPRYKFPPVSLLNEHKAYSSFDNREVIENKENIVKTLGDHKIPVKYITATVGPTVTLYEVVPERGVRLARIKSLENDIALNLSALGIRIIAPIPGRGTVGIEVPNKNPEIVSMRSLITSKAFQESKYELPLALGRTITNEPYIADLTRMPHLLVAGATGQGKSVGINAIITSLLYKKHPAEVKFILIDPKRVELPLYAKIERHFLAKLPGEEDAIITDTQKVIYTLNSLCIEMDNRLELLKAAQARNIKEYNEKFISRRLNPEKGHRFMPYIVLIIDEFADLIMTAGREIEGPIGRLAQLGRAIGIHLIISTQRPSTNIITGFIKANFPTRIAFRVFSSVDSRTILDSTGADKLVGRGDMLISSGSEPVRLQCAFIDTPEIEALTEYIGSQQGYADAMHLPEYIADSEAGEQEVDLRKRDPMFDDAARIVVQYQQGSTSLIQRKLSIGYNRAGRIIDQLEAAGIVGPFEGSKARDVLVSDMMSLEHILKNLDK
ncbi:MAG TPA: DNA translocase FtsK 4TM domain-containing protein [Bacteroidales bacterium]|nr:DNA translocase FtsK 4TM domain-containing protein [Bacteroidales bacterium]HQG36604.1 DNA translocase FtsK 4TM domain-containing protein [Bacteroidales bacterium]HQG53224.1 DNA translocase FtsK 4TM domain-containing protein [Bacteroidales bacterium]HQJ20604.1 DNA translocase FtsK 4TM domain-containing protein [Bacteroidales bacterium]HRC89756.1 DNA translocase FtsK 4TM domain-containing protein [Bacteroidales bacterium]